MEWLKSLFPNLRQASIRWSEDDASSLAASVAYYLALSLFPLCLLLVSGLGLFLNFTSFGQSAMQQLLATVESQGSQFTKNQVAVAMSNLSQPSEQEDDDSEARQEAEQRLLETIEAVSSQSVRKQLAQVISSLGEQSKFSGPLSFLAAALAAIGVFAQLDRGFDRIWRVPAPKDASLVRMILRVMRHRFVAFTMLVCLGAMIALLFLGSVVWSHVRTFAGSTLPGVTHIIGILDFVFMTLANGFLFALVYRWLPKRPVGWHEALRGGLLASLIWQVGRYILGSFFIGMQYSTAYGAVGSLIAILLWCYYGVSIIFFGAEYVQVLQVRRAKRTQATSHLSVASQPVNVLSTMNSLSMRATAIRTSIGHNSIDIHQPIMDTIELDRTTTDASRIRQKPRRSTP